MKRLLLCSLLIASCMAKPQIVYKNIPRQIEEIQQHREERFSFQNVLSFVKIYTTSKGIDSGHGSGVIFDEDDLKLYIFTAKHVVKEEEPNFFIGGIDHDEERVQLVGEAILEHVSKRGDIAILSIEKEKFKGTPYRVADLISNRSFKRLPLGALVYCIGAPMQMDCYVTAGTLAQKWSKTGKDFFRVSANSIFGGSGGPVFDSYGRLIGITAHIGIYSHYRGLQYITWTVGAVKPGSLHREVNLWRENLKKAKPEPAPEKSDEESNQEDRKTYPRGIPPASEEDFQD